MPSVRSVLSTTRPGSTGRVKLGQPVPESNLSIELNSGSPVVTSTYKPAPWLSQNSLWNGGSVPSFCVTSYCIGLSFRRRTSSAGLV